MSDFLTRLREEADRRLDPRDAATLQRELEDHLRAATAAYEEVGNPDPARAAEAALGSPRRLVRAVARRTRRGDGFRLALVGWAWAGGGYTAASVIAARVLDADVWPVALFLISLLAGAFFAFRAGRVRLRRGLAGFALGGCLLVALPFGEGAFFGRVVPEVPGWRSTSYALRTVADAVRGHRDDARRDLAALASPPAGRRPFVDEGSRLEWIGPDRPEYATATANGARRELRAQVVGFGRTLDRVARARPATLAEIVPATIKQHSPFWRLAGGWGLALLLLGRLSRLLPGPRQRRRRA